MLITEGFFLWHGKCNKKGKFHQKELDMKKLVMAGFLSLALLVLLAVSPLQARGPMGGGMMDCPGLSGGGFPGKGNWDRLNLSAEQTAKLASLREAAFKEIAPLKEKLFSTRNELRNLWLEATPNEAKITALQREVRNQMGQLQDRMTAFRLEAAKLLTQEQRDKLRAGLAGPGPGSRWADRCRMARPAERGPKGPRTNTAPAN
jgi:Spy/CpxP family protein refolding chaperone